MCQMIHPENRDLMNLCVKLIFRLAHFATSQKLRGIKNQILSIINRHFLLFLLSKAIISKTIRSKLILINTI